MAPNSSGAGIILMRVDGHAPRFFLLCGRDSGIWSFAKGHPEETDGGDLLRTAIRETYEETGLYPVRDYEFLSDSQRFGKRPYWVARVEPTAFSHMRLSPREHSMGGWFTVEEIAQMRTNVDVRAWIKKAMCPTSVVSGLITSHAEREAKRSSDDDDDGLTHVIRCASAPESKRSSGSECIES